MIRRRRRVHSPVTMQGWMRILEGGDAVPDRSGMTEGSRGGERPSGRVTRAIRDASVPGKFLLLLLAMFLFKGILIALVFPPYSGHDEVAHYAYLQTLAEEGRVPLIPDVVEWRA